MDPRIPPRDERPSGPPRSRGDKAATLTSRPLYPHFEACD
jgi:hypothetical protein